MSDARLTFVLVHGAWCGGWVWHEVRDALEARGHRVYTPTLTGLADRSHQLSGQIDLTTHIDDVANLIRWEGLSGIVLVGHSYGGLVITGVADRIGAAAISAIVYLDGFYLADGERTTAAQDDVHRPRLIEVDGVRCLAPPDTAAAFGLEAALAGRVNALLTPMPAAVFAQRPVVAGERDRVARKGFVVAERCTMPFFRPIAQALEQNPSWTVERIATDHFMMIDHPQLTADILIKLSAS